MMRCWKKIGWKVMRDGYSSGINRPSDRCANLFWCLKKTSELLKVTHRAQRWIFGGTYVLSVRNFHLILRYNHNWGPSAFIPQTWEVLLFFVSRERCRSSANFGTEYCCLGNRWIDFTNAIGFGWFMVWMRFHSHNYIPVWGWGWGFFIIFPSVLKERWNYNLQTQLNSFCPAHLGQ